GGAWMCSAAGLFAERFQSPYLNTPPKDRAAEIKGRQVLDKFNCGGCHQLRPGVFEVRNNARGRELLHSAVKNPDGSLKTFDEIKFDAKNARAGPDPRKAQTLPGFGTHPRRAQPRGE